MQLPPLIKATLIKRYKRFLADVTLGNGDIITVHCPNTGAMTGCAEPGYEVWLSTSTNKKRKYPYTWELARTTEGDWIGVHSANANRWVEAAIRAARVSELTAYREIQTEVKYGDEASRIDLLLSAPTRSALPPLCYVEVKSVTLLASRDAGLGLFPDAVSIRGQKHLRELIAMREQGHRAVLFFCVLHSGIKQVAPADSIDPAYGQLFREALSKGVEVLAYGTAISTAAISLAGAIKVLNQEPEY